MGDFNIYINSFGVEKNELWNLFDLTNFTHGDTCCTKSYKSARDLILTNRSLSFQNISSRETDLSDYHKCISSFFKFHYARLKPKVVNHRNYKNFNQSTFLKEIESTDFSIDSDDQASDQSFD